MFNPFKRSPKLTDQQIARLQSIGWELLQLAVAVGLSVYAVKSLTNALTSVLNGSSPDKSIVSVKKMIAKKLKRPELESMELTAHEAAIGGDVIACDDITTSFEDIGGMDEQLEDVKDHIVLPMQTFKFFKENNSKISCPTGVLLWKTLTAKAIAKECGGTFICVKASTLMDKFFGETDKLVAALFSLSKKLAPAVVFIDEIDTLLATRGGASQNSPALHSMQGVFLSEWDGLQESNGAPVVVVGATNRPSDLDKAFLRRMPLTIEMKMPDAAARKDILEKLLVKTKLAPDVDLQFLSDNTSGCSGSDLRELIRAAQTHQAKRVVAELKRLSREKPQGQASAQTSAQAVDAALTQEHFLLAMKRAQKADVSAEAFTDSVDAEDGKNDQNRILVQYMKQLMGSS